MSVSLEKGCRQHTVRVPNLSVNSFIHSDTFSGLRYYCLGLVSLCSVKTGSTGVVSVDLTDTLLTENGINGNLAHVVVSMLCCNFLLMCVQARSPEEAEIPLKHQLLQMIVRVLQYRMLLTGNSRNWEIPNTLYSACMPVANFSKVEENCCKRLCQNLNVMVYIFLHQYNVLFSMCMFADYLNNLSPDSKEYEDTQGTAAEHAV